MSRRGSAFGLPVEEGRGGGVTVMVLFVRVAYSSTAARLCEQFLCSFVFCRLHNRKTCIKQHFSEEQDKDQSRTGAFGNRPPSGRRKPPVQPPALGVSQLRMDISAEGHVDAPNKKARTSALRMRVVECCTVPWLRVLCSVGDDHNFPPPNLSAIAAAGGRHIMLPNGRVVEYF